MKNEFRRILTSLFIGVLHKDIDISNTKKFLGNNLLSNQIVVLFVKI